MKLSPADKVSLYARAGVNAFGLLGARTHPPAIIWVLTQRCFYECIHCDSWKDTSPIDAEALLAIAGKIAAAPTRIVSLSGGEPFMVKCLREIVGTLKRAKKVVTINTNGHLLEEHADWLIAEAVDHVQVSVDGHDAALHDAIRRRHGSFEKILRGIEILRARRPGRVPRVSVCGVLMKENAAHLATFVDRFARVADAVEMQPLHESPGLLATAGAQSFAPGDRPLVEAQLAAVIDRHPAFADDFYRTFPRFLFEADSMHHFAVDHCLPMIFSTLTIREDGACRICRYPLGENIREKSLREIWSSPARWALYRSLARDGCAEPCWIRCHVHPSRAPGTALRRVIRAIG
jgi:MoaA/NifB/PqqE/SkfB family radical SAM enzyme